MWSLRDKVIKLLPKLVFIGLVFGYRFQTVQSEMRQKGEAKLKVRWKMSWWDVYKNVKLPKTKKWKGNKEANIERCI